MIWFDLDNSPHIPIFRPVFHELDAMQEKYFVTARDFAQTKQLLELYEVPHLLVGKHGGKSKLYKVANLLQRSFQLRSALKNKNAELAVSHGSRTQLMAAKSLGVKSIWLLDYEYTENKLVNFLSQNILMPKYIPDSRLKEAGFNLRKIIRYNGFKEDLYLNSFVPQTDFRKEIGIDESKILVVVRPPSLVANYHDAKSEQLLIAGLNHFLNDRNVECLIVSRTIEDKNYIISKLGKKPNLKFLNKVVDGLQLVYSADYLISGGGTMNREAALLGTKTFSIFTGKRPYLDELLQDQGKLKFIESISDFHEIEIKRQFKQIHSYSNNLAEEITDIILEIAHGKSLVKMPDKELIFNKNI